MAEALAVTVMVQRMLSVVSLCQIKSTFATSVAYGLVAATMRSRAFPGLVRAVDLEFALSRLQHRLGLFAFQHKFDARSVRAAPAAFAQVTDHQGATGTAPPSYGISVQPADTAGRLGRGVSLGCPLQPPFFNWMDAGTISIRALSGPPQGKGKYKNIEIC